MLIQQLNRRETLILTFATELEANLKGKKLKIFSIAKEYKEFLDYIISKSMIKNSKLFNTIKKMKIDTNLMLHLRMKTFESENSRSTSENTLLLTTSA